MIAMEGSPRGVSLSTFMKESTHTLQAVDVSCLSRTVLRSVMINFSKPVAQRNEGIASHPSIYRASMFREMLLSSAGGIEDITDRPKQNEIAGTPNVACFQENMGVVAEPFIRTLPNRSRSMVLISLWTLTRDAMVFVSL